MDNTGVLPPAKGTKLKLSVTADLGDLSMDDVDFNCTFFRADATSRKQTVTKEEMVRIDRNEYVAVVDTAVIGAGEYYLKFTAYLPDTDVSDGIRPEVVSVPTGIRVTN